MQPNYNHNQGPKNNFTFLLEDARRITNKGRSALLVQIKCPPPLSLCAAVPVDYDKLLKVFAFVGQYETVGIIYFICNGHSL